MNDQDKNNQHDEYWMERLALPPLEPPYVTSAGAAALLRSAGAAGGAAPPGSVTLDVPAGLSETQLLAAYAAWLHRLTGGLRFSLGYTDPTVLRSLRQDGASLSGHLPLLFAIEGSESFETVARAAAQEIGRAVELADAARDLMVRLPDLIEPRYFCSVAVLEGEPANQGGTEAAGAQLTLRIQRGAPRAALDFDPGSLEPATAQRMAQQLGTWLRSVASAPTRPLAQLPLVDDAEQRRLVVELNDTAQPYPKDRCVHQLFEAQVDRTPDAPAVVFANRTLSYVELNRRANRLAHVLIAAGAKPDQIVGLCLERTEDLVIAALAIQKAGAGYLPLDPSYPRERQAFMAKDSGAALIVCQTSTAALMAGGSAELIDIDVQRDAIVASSADNPRTAVQPDHLAYAIYTSGSTGTPKGVLIEHRNVVNFFTGMDAHIDPSGKQGRTWLAVTSLSFDISVLELFWTLSRGYQIVLAAEDRSNLETKGTSGRSERPIEFSLFYFASDEGGAGPEKYRLLTEGARFADDNDFVAVWTPERHFGAFGGIYPNPAVAGAALAMITKRVQIRAGSCVVPLHHPVRIAEEWSLVDNLSNGRVAISFATGWHPKDFLLRPENFADRRNATLEGIETIRRLWRGEEVTFPSPVGPTAVATRPRPVQPELPFWFTAAGNPATFETAGKLGANVLTHLLGQSVDDLVTKITAYRRAWREAGHAGQGKVSLMLHTFVGDDDARVKEIVRAPMKGYLRSSIELIGEHAWSFPAFKKVANQKDSLTLNFNKLAPEDMEDLLEYSFERYYEGSGLFGTIDTCSKQIERLKALGVDEIACLIDFGVATETVLKQLPALNRLRQATFEGAAPPTIAEDDFSLSALIQRNKVSHLQCTPSMMRMLLANDDTRAALGRVRHLMVGGEALTDVLVNDIAAATPAKLSNMYGPTETTIWSSVDTVVPGQTVTIGRPIANTQLYVLDGNRQVVPQGAPGELYIAGDGVARGYHHREELTATRFVADPFAGAPGARMYRTGDLVRHLADGRIEFIGRVDHQVKLRGYRIELGEIEAVLSQQDGVRDAVVIVREDRAGDPRLVAYLIGDESRLDPAKLRAALGARLPDYMVPSAFVRLERFPLTPNKKVDRKALPPPSDGQQSVKTAYVQPENEVEQRVSSVYQAVLGIEKVGRDDNFFELGGHSLLAVQAHRKLREVLERDLAITDIFRFPTVKSLCAHLQSAGAKDEKLGETKQRASARREALLRRRGGTADGGGG